MQGLPGCTMDYTPPSSSHQPVGKSCTQIPSAAMQVHIELQGDDGCSGRFLLPSNPGDFRKGNTVMFTLDRMPCVGRLRSLTVCADGRGMFPSWRLRWVHCFCVLHTAVQYWAKRCYFAARWSQ